ncbi:SOS-response transcriptional repressor, LexA [Longilinea arvoryzae]|uniref:LexA repressor n=1 Tax=Longilinea arvoryzae TaxID=360412 RepID=A0A0S7BGZ9_9CHLR|nr:transcriptional repressor LexA [Longilinea arvoryzae]GAP13131.1 SOS-response transcriptional repressor, LexA [Longilinea arvoryzae]
MARRSVGLSDRHRRIMEFLTAFQEQNGYSPSIRQIGDHITVKSTSLVDYYLNQLEEMGYITREGRVSRSIRVLRPMYSGVGARVGDAVRKVAANISDLIQIPIMGRIVASAPIPMPTSDLAYFDSESSVEMARSLLPAREKPSELFALEVQGDSMIDAMINDGDIVILKPAQEANNGDMVAVWLDDRDETTLKYFYKENDRIRLQPANPTMGPIYVDNPASLRIMGKVVMVIRQVRTAL